MTEQKIDEQSNSNDSFELYFVQFEDPTIEILKHKKTGELFCVSESKPYVFFISPLMMSIKLEDEKAFDVLLQSCPDDIDDPLPMSWDIIYERGFTPLHFAVHMCNPYFVRQLLIAGANPNSKADSKVTPLMTCFQDLIYNPNIKEARIKIVNDLINAGAYVNLQTTEGKTALMFTIDMNDGLIDFDHANIEMTETFMELLLQKNANPRICDKSGKSAFDYLQKYIDYFESKDRELHSRYTNLYKILCEYDSDS